MKRRTFIQKTSAAALSPLLAGVATAEAPPNIVLIVCDDLGYGDLSCYGSRIQTPNIDRLAEEGVLFRQFYSGNPVCSPSRAALLTGRYGVRVGVPTVLWPNDPGGMSTNETTIAEMLKPRGYSTMCIGKWHLGRPPQYLPTSRGFDEYFGIPYSNDMDPSILMHNTDVVESPVDLTTLTKRYTAKAVDFIRASRNTPFFLYMPHTFPHLPLAASPDFVGKSAMGLYGDVVQEIDWSVGQVMAALGDSAGTQNTLVMFTSDHGPWFQGSPGGLRGRKGDTFEGGMRVPFVARFPGRIAANTALRGAARRGPRVVETMATALDLLPTIAGFTQAQLPRNPLDGADIGLVLTGQANDVSRPMFLYFNNVELQCARQGSWKLHISRANVPAYTATPAVGLYNLRLINPELYNIDLDPDESVDVAAQNPDIVASIQESVARLLPSLPSQVQSAWRDTQNRPVNPNVSGAYPTPVLP